MKKDPNSDFFLLTKATPPSYSTTNNKLTKLKNINNPLAATPYYPYRIHLKFKKEGKINSETMRNMRQLHARWPQSYGQPMIHKLGAPIRPVVSFYNTPLSALHKVLALYLKPLRSDHIGRQQPRGEEVSKC